MELWLLGGGAIVLIAIALWLVWPAYSADRVGNPDRGEEVSPTPMTDSIRPSMLPQGERFEDQYTSATADLSAGGVAATFGSFEDHEDASPSAVPHSVPTQDPVASTRGERWPEASVEGERIGHASRVENFPYAAEPANSGFSIMQPKTLSIGAGTLLALCGAIGGVWLFVRWQRERNKPINRLRRGARDAASRLGERMPDIDELPIGAAPMSGAASALLLTALLATRALRRPPPEARVEDASDKASMLIGESLRKARGLSRDTLGRGRDLLDQRDDAMDYSRRASRRLAAKARGLDLPDVASSARFDRPKPAFLGLGFGGLAIVAGGSYVVWRLLRGSTPSPQQTWYAGE